MAAEREISGGLQVEEDREWQEKFWTTQRVAWIVMALIIVAAILGLTGKGGPLASATAKVSSASIEYPRITRWQSDEQLTVRLPPNATGEVDLALSAEFAELFAVDSIEPEPTSSSATASGHKFTFDVAGSGEKRIVFNVATGKPVIARRFTASLGNAATTDMTVTILP